MLTRSRREHGGGFRVAHLAVAFAGACGAIAVAVPDAATWVRWLTNDEELTASRLARVSTAQMLLALAGASLTVLGLAGALLPDAARSGYRRARLWIGGAIAARKRGQEIGAFAAVSSCGLLALLGLAWSVHRLTDTPLADLSRDPASVLGVAPWVGMLSNLGIVLWASTAAVCFLGAVLLRDRGAEAREIGLLWASGALVTLLMLDDLFLLHEAVLPRATGLPELAFSAMYPVLFVALLARYGATILTLDWSLLLIATLLLGASLGIDTLWDSTRRSFVEDAFKLAGILAWLGFSARAVRSGLSARGRVPAPQGTS